MPLPPEPFELSEWKMATVQMNYHIQVNKMNYSVPYEYVGKRVEVRQTNSIVEIYYKGTRICSHARLHGRANQYSTNNDHMPENHKLFEWNKERFEKWAKGIGKNTYEVIHRLISRYKVEEQSYKSCISLLNIVNIIFTKNVNLKITRNVNLLLPVLLTYVYLFRPFLVFQHIHKILGSI